MATETTPRTCVFCGAPSSELTKEHVFPAWLRKVLGGGPAQHRHWSDYKGEVTRSVSYDRAAFSLEVRRVCGRCNNGWMHDLERAARPYLRSMMRGQNRTLDGDAQRAVATWALKTAMMFQYTVPEDERAIPAAHYQYVFERREPPLTTFVTLAAYGGSYWSAYTRQHPLRMRLPEEAEAPGYYDGYVATLGVGQLVLHILGTEEQTFRPRFGAAVQPALHPIWPQRERVTWTASLALADSAVDALADALDPSLGRDD